MPLLSVSPDFAEITAARLQHAGWPDDDDDDDDDDQCMLTEAFRMWDSAWRTQVLLAYYEQSA